MYADDFGTGPINRDLDETALLSYPFTLPSTMPVTKYFCRKG